MTEIHIGSRFSVILDFDFQSFIVPILKVFNAKYIDIFIISYFGNYFKERTSSGNFIYRTPVSSI